MRSNLEFGLNILSLVQICKWSLQISNRAKRGIFFLKKKKSKKKKLFGNNLSSTLKCCVTAMTYHVITNK